MLKIFWRNGCFWVSYRKHCKRQSMQNVMYKHLSYTLRTSENPAQYHALNNPLRSFFLPASHGAGPSALSRRKALKAQLRSPPSICRSFLLSSHSSCPILLPLALQSHAHLNAVILKLGPTSESSREQFKNFDVQAQHNRLNQNYGGREEGKHEISP